MNEAAWPEPGVRPWFFATLHRAGLLRRARIPDARDEAPLRSELFTADQMEQHGKSVAAAHELTRKHFADRLLPRLAANERTLVDACTRLARSAEAHRRVTPAGESTVNGRRSFFWSTRTRPRSGMRWWLSS